jgi:hypothetical protein
VVLEKFQGTCPNHQLQLVPTHFCHMSCRSCGGDCLHPLRVCTRQTGVRCLRPAASNGKSKQRRSAGYTLEINPLQQPYST